MFGVDSLKQAKAERLMYGESVMTHAMVLTGVNLVVCKTKLNFVYLTMIAKQFIPTIEVILIGTNICACVGENSCSSKR